MAKDKRRIQQNRAKKKAREAARKKQRHAQQGRQASGRFDRIGCTRAEIQLASIHAAYLGETAISRGTGHAIVARKLPNGNLAVGAFLLDTYCLGVKNAFLMAQSTFDFEEMIEDRFPDDHLQPVAPAFARKFVDEAVAYARDLGFEPHPDFRDASVVLHGIDPGECTAEFTFGCEGKPLYISGPHDSEAMIRRVVSQLNARRGPDGAHYRIGPD